MGHTSYSMNSRSLRAEKLSYDSAPRDEIFKQNKEQKIHQSMSPNGVLLREARDSSAHPNTVPIILNLDVTGSMGTIPHQLIQEGLPKLMGSLIQRGVEDAALLFTAIGDHEVDQYPFQVGQFESGDEELDTWLTRTYIESGGGGNMGESYLLAHYFAANRVEIDSLGKRGQKGFLFTLGDEPGLSSISSKDLERIFGPGQYKNYTDQELLEEASKKWHVFHLLITRGWQRESAAKYWKQILGERCIDVDDINKIPEYVAQTILSTLKKEPSLIVEKKDKPESSEYDNDEEML